MERRYITLQTIYDLVRQDAHPTSYSLHYAEIIVRQNFPWDEIVRQLEELEKEHFIQLKRFTATVISITAKGIEQAVSLRSATAA